MKEKVLKIWPEIQLIKNEELKQKVIDCWIYAFNHSSLAPEDLETIPFSLLINKKEISFISHKRTTVQIAIKIAEIMKKNFTDSIEIDLDVLTAGAILIDIGKLLEYTKENNKLTTSKEGKLLRHPFSGVAIAERFDLPAEVLHIIATHSKEGDIGKRTIESIIVHHADFVSFEPLLDSKIIQGKV